MSLGTIHPPLKGSIIKGKRVRENLNGHYVTVVLPGRKLSYEEGTRRMIELFRSIKRH